MEQDFKKMLSLNKKEIAEAIKKEYPGGQEYIFDGKLSKEDILTAIENMKMCESFEEGLKISFDNDEILFEAYREAVNNVEDVVLDFLGFRREMLDETELEFLEEFAYDHLEYSIDIESLKENTSRIEEITVRIYPPGNAGLAKYQAGYDGEFLINPERFSYKGLEMTAKELMSPENVDPIDWLIQTQGYELADLYDPGKVKNSRFLESLRSELCDYTSILNGNITFTAIGGDFESLEAVLLGNKDIIVRPENQGYIGITGHGCGSGLDIKLEREVVIPRRWIDSDFAVSSHEISEYGVQNTYGLVDNQRSDVFRETDKAPIKMEPLNFEKLKKAAIRTDMIRNRIEEVASELEELPEVREAYPSVEIIPELTVEMKFEDEMYRHLMKEYEFLARVSKETGLQAVNIEGNRFHCRYTAEKVEFTRDSLSDELIRETVSVSERTGQEVSIKEEKEKEEIVFKEGKVLSVPKKYAERVNDILEKEREAKECRKTELDSARLS